MQVTVLTAQWREQTALLKETQETAMPHVDHSCSGRIIRKRGSKGEKEHLSNVAQELKGEQVRNPENLAQQRKEQLQLVAMEESAFIRTALPPVELAAIELRPYQVSVL